LARIADELEEPFVDAVATATLWAFDGDSFEPPHRIEQDAEIEIPRHSEADIASLRGHARPH